MPPFKMSVTVFGNTFNAEGDYAQVHEQFARWLEVLRAGGDGPRVAPLQQPDSMVVPAAKADQVSSEAIGRLFEEVGEEIRLKSLPEGQGSTLHGILAILLGFREVKGVAEVTGGRIMQSLDRSGIPVDRVDREVETVRDLVNASGVRRAKKYGLTTKGLTAAKAIAHGLLEKLPL